MLVQHCRCSLNIGGFLLCVYLISHAETLPFLNSRIPVHQHTRLVFPVQLIITATLHPNLTPRPRHATAPQHTWTWAPALLQKTTTTSIAPCSIAFACRTGPVCRMVPCMLQTTQLLTTVPQTVFTKLWEKKLTVEKIPPAQSCVTYNNILSKRYLYSSRKHFNILFLLWSKIN